MKKDNWKKYWRTKECLCGGGLLFLCIATVFLFWKGFMQDRTEYEIVQKAYLILAAIVVIGIMLLYYMVVVRKSKIHHLYLVIAVTLGIVYCALMPPYVVPDEPVHYEECYDVSNFLLGTGKAEKGMIYMRASDVDSPFEAYPTMETYQNICKNIFISCTNDTIVEVKRDSGDNNSICYIIPGIGLTVGRILHLGTVLTFLLSRWCNYIVFILLIYWSLKKAPIGKNCILVFSMLPMVLQQAMSVSYDCITNGVAVFLIAQCLYMVYKKDEIHWRDLLLYGIFAAVLAGIKGGVYLPICCLALIIPMRKFASKKKYFLSAGMILAAILVSFLVTNYSMLSAVMTENRGGDSILSTDVQEIEKGDLAKEIFITGKEQHYSFSDIISNPVHYVKVMRSTINEYGDHYLRTMIGGLLGWLDIEIPWWILFGFFAMLLFSAVEDNELVLSYKQKLWMVLMFCTMVLMVMTVMYISWTPVNYPQVLGVQGRYFLPGLLLLPLVFKNRTILAKRDIFPVLISVTMCLQVCTWFFALKSILS